MLLQLFGYIAFLLPIVLGALAWIAMFGLKRESKGENDLDPALRLVGLVGFLIAGTGFLHVRLFSGDVASAGGILGKLVGNSLTVGFGALGPTCSCWCCCWPRSPWRRGCHGSR